jgi:hypothetical protein
MTGAPRAARVPCISPGCGGRGFNRDTSIGRVSRKAMCDNSTAKGLEHCLSVTQNTRSIHSRLGGEYGGKYFYFLYYTYIKPRAGCESGDPV